MDSEYEALAKNGANYQALSPLSFIRRTADVFPDRLAVIYEDRRYSWAETYNRVMRLASALAKRGIKKGDTVSIMAANTPEMFEAHFGVPMAGAVLNAINTRLEVETVAYILDHSDAKVVMVDTALSSVVAEALKSVKRDILVVDIVDAAGPGGDRIGALDYEALLAEGNPDIDWKGPADEWQALTLNYTSGTSGRPKGVVYHHRGSYLMSMGTVVAWELPRHPTYLYTVPMFHCNGWGHAWTMTLLAGTIVCNRAVSAKAVFGAIRQHEVTHFGGAPIVLSMLIDAPEEDRVPLEHPVKVMTAGAPPPAAVLEKTRAMGFEVMQVYGLTETFGHVTQALWREDWDDLSFAEQAELQSWQGVSFPMNESAAVINRETGELAPRDGETQGEIAICGNTVMKGYYKSPDETDEAFVDGWFRTGDAAVWHDNGYIQIKDRLKDVIISGGENVSSVEVEGVLYRHPAVAAAAVVAKPDDKWGEVPCAFIELKVGESLTEEELIGFCRERMAGFKRPKKVVFGELPKTATGKIQKFVLREKARET
ncbi:acyl-CoA synthetase [Pelagibius sp. Alg239-R121]|uniref:acyl-CoA synthetase n=1 Tax=Pelagibius sp. Alg239-R121 TaxID=2993448 RepID=UPI0024A75013|nr:acyl-CoA synthetase [Pelagibius sp. Alg239-R121]